MAVSKEELHRLIDRLSDEQVQRLANALPSIVVPVDDEPLTPEDIRDIEAARADNDYMTLDEFNNKYGEDLVFGESYTLKRGDKLMKGIVHNAKRQMSEVEATEFLKQGRVAHVGTVDQDGYPYVIPLIYVYEGGDRLYLHTGNLRESHFLENLKSNPKICIEVSFMGDVHPGEDFACDSALVYSSVVAFGATTIIEEDEKLQTWFFDKIFAKYGNPNWNFQLGYPAMSKTRLFEVILETVTGKHSEGLQH